MDGDSGVCGVRIGCVIVAIWRGERGRWDVIVSGDCSDAHGIREGEWMMVGSEDLMGSEGNSCRWREKK